MREEGLLDALAALCEGKAHDQNVEVAAEILLTAHNELLEKSQIRKELEMARDEAQGMKPSVARKLNEKIRALEAELDTLRTNKKVADLERKVKFLEQELKQSYTTKNFTLKSGLLELEKQYRAHMNVDPAMAAFWADVTVLLDEKKDKDSQPQLKGPPSLSASSTPRVPTLSQQQDGTAAAQQDQQARPAAVSSSSSQSGVANATGPSSVDEAAAAGTAVGSEPKQLQSHPASCGVQMQVDAFNSIISDEAAGAATLPSSSDGSSTAAQPGDHMPRQAGSFRIVRAQQHPTACPADGTVVQESLQPVQVLKDSYNPHACKDLQYQPLPVSLSGPKAGAAPGTTQQQLVADAWAQDSCRDNIRSSVIELQQLSSQLPADSSLLQQQLEQLGTSAQQLLAAADTQQPQQQEVEQLLHSVQHIAAAWEQPSSSGRGAAVEAVAQQLHMLQQELQQLHQLQQQSLPQLQSQQLTLQVFEEFIRQLEQQGIIPSNETAVAADSTQEHQQQRHVLLQLLKDFLQMNPHLPQLLVSSLLPPPAGESDSSNAAPAKHPSSSTVGVQQSPESNHVSIQAAVPVDAVHAETQIEPLPSPAVHASTQAGVTDLVHAETQHDNSHLPALDVGTQAAAEHTSASTQAEGVELLHVETQLDLLPSPSTHVATQVASELVSVAIQADPPSSSTVHAEVQAEMKPQVAEAALQVDLTAAAGSLSVSTASPSPVVADGTTQPAGFILPQAHQLPGLAEEQQQEGSGIIYLGSGSELPVSKVAIGQQLDVLHQLQQQHINEAAHAAAGVAEHSDDSHHLSAVVQVKSEELLDVQAVAKELSQLRADNIELAASLQVTKSLVDHLNSSMKSAIDKADDAEAEATHVRVQLDLASSSLQQLQAEHADLTKLLIEAKVEIAEKNGELLELVRNLRRAVEKPTSAAGMVKELQEILAVLPAAQGGQAEPEGRSNTDLQARPAAAGSSVGALAGLAAGLGQAFGGGSISRRSRAPSDAGSAEDAAGAAGGKRISQH